jgi:hypothetical protein
MLGKDYPFPNIRLMWRSESRVENCKNCGQITAEPKELIRIVKDGKRIGASG